MGLIDADTLHREISKWPESVMYKDWVQSAIANASTITPPPNDPLTLDELREMDGEPVWNDTTKRWVIVDTHSRTTINVNGCWRPFSDRYYRRKPEE